MQNKTGVCEQQVWSAPESGAEMGQKVKRARPKVPEASQVEKPEDGTGREGETAACGREERKEGRRQEARGYRHCRSHGGQKLLSPSFLPCHCPILLLLRLQHKHTTLKD